MVNKAMSPNKELRTQSPSPRSRSRTLSMSSDDSRSVTSVTMSISSVTSSVKRSLTPRMEIELKREMKKKLEAEQFTFKPKIYSQNSYNSEFSPDRGSGAKRFEALYLDAKKRQQNNSQLMDSLLEQEDLTFRPSLSSNNSVTSADVSVGEVVDRLYKFEKLKLKREMQAKKEEEARRAAGTPRLNAVTRSLSASRASKLSDSGVPLSVEDRLFKYGEIKQKKLEAATEEKKKKELEGVTFKPVIPESSKRSGTPTRESVFERLTKPIEQHQEKLGLMKKFQSLQVSTDFTFQPSVPTRSRSLSVDRMSKLDSPTRLSIEERLRRYDEEKAKKLENIAKEFRRKEDEKSTFKPIISPNSKRYATPSRTGDLFERLSKPVDKAGLAAKQLAELEASFFQPNLSLTSGRSTPTVGRSRSGSNASAYSTTESVHDRLYKEADEHRHKLELEREMRELELLKDATFSPRINPRSEEMPTEDGDVFERLATNKVYVHEVLRQVKEDMEMAECTFKPVINPPDNVSENGSSMSKASSPRSGPIYKRLLAEGERQKAEQERAQAAFRALQERELTFRPTISKYEFRKAVTPFGTAPVLPVHSRLYAEAERLRDEQKRREQDAIAEKEKQLNFNPTIPTTSRALAAKLKEEVVADTNKPSPRHYEYMTASAVLNIMAKAEEKQSRSTTPLKTLSPRQSQVIARLSAGQPTTSGEVEVTDGKEMQRKHSSASNFNYPRIYQTKSPKGSKVPKPSSFQDDGSTVSSESFYSCVELNFTV